MTDPTTDHAAAIQLLRAEFEDDASVDRLVRTWLDQVPVRLAAIAAGEDPAVRPEGVRAAHQLAGSSGFVGAQDVELVARRVEDAAQATPEQWMLLANELANVATAAAASVRRALDDWQAGR